MRKKLLLTMSLVVGSLALFGCGADNTNTVEETQEVETAAFEEETTESVGEETADDSENEDTESTDAAKEATEAEGESSSAFSDDTLALSDKIEVLYDGVIDAYVEGYDSLSATLHDYILKNNSDQTVTVMGYEEAVLRDGSTVPIAGNEWGIAPGEEVFIAGGYSGIHLDDVDSFRVNDDIGRLFIAFVDDEYVSISEFMDLKYEVDGNTVKYKVTNNSDYSDPAIEVDVVFLKDGKIVNADISYAVRLDNSDNNYAVKPGETSDENIVTCDEEFDDVKVVLHSIHSTKE